MTEYIDKNMINERMLEYAVISGLNHHKMSAFILNIPTADVIERYKIDKAIEEIEEVSFKHYFEQGEYIGEITEQWEVVKLDHVLEILKRNIGE